MIRLLRGHTKVKARAETFRAHGTPLSDPENDEEFETLEAWLKSYDPASLFDEAGGPNKAVQSLLPEPDKRLARLVG